MNKNGGDEFVRMYVYVHMYVCVCERHRQTAQVRWEDVLTASDERRHADATLDTDTHHMIALEIRHGD